MLDAAPGRTLALVVGIDFYEYGDAWRLDGAAADALRFVDWLIRHKVPKANIALFLSSASWTGDLGVKAWEARNGWEARRNATGEDIANFVEKELKVWPGDGLLMYWGGHGVVDDIENLNYFYTEDAAADRPRGVNVQTLLKVLHGPGFAHLRQQVGIFDACATPLSATGERARMGEASFSVPNQRFEATAQFLMFSASSGQVALHASERRTGVFSEAIFAQLATCSDTTWPDFLDAFKAVMADVKNKHLGAQQPLLVINCQRMEAIRSGYAPGPPTRVSSLQALIEKRSIPVGLLYRLYLRSLPDYARRIAHGGLQGWLLHLDDSRPRAVHHPSPIIEFAERLGREIEQLQRADLDPGNGAVLRKWAKRRANALSYRVLTDQLNAEEATKRGTATLFIEINTGAKRELRWWVQTPDPRSCSAQQLVALGPDPIEPALANHLRAIIGAAFDAVGHKYEPLVSFLLPAELLHKNFESTIVEFFDEGLPTEALPLNKRYPVLLHWHMRARPQVSGQAIGAWRQALMRLGPRIRAGGGAEVVWLEPAIAERFEDRFSLATEQLLSSQGSGICVGLGYIQSAGQGGISDVIAKCLRAGVPCFFWLERPPDDPAQAQTILCTLFGSEKATDAPVTVGKKRFSATEDDPLLSLRIVWDEPGYLPQDQEFRGPDQGEPT